MNNNSTGRAGPKRQNESGKMLKTVKNQSAKKEYKGLCLMNIGVDKFWLSHFKAFVSLLGPRPIQEYTTNLDQYFMNQT